LEKGTTAKKKRKKRRVDQGAARNAKKVAWGQEYFNFPHPENTLTENTRIRRDGTKKSPSLLDSHYCKGKKKRKHLRTKKRGVTYANPPGIQPGKGSKSGRARRG